MACAQRNMTFKDLVVSAVDQALNEAEGLRFVLRDCSAGYCAVSGGGVSSQAINDAIDAGREGRSVQ